MLGLGERLRLRLVVVDAEDLRVSIAGVMVAGRVCGEVVVGEVVSGIVACAWLTEVKPLLFVVSMFIL